MRFARVARTAAAACGVVEGFSVDELGDIRLLVDEVFVAMYELGVPRVELGLTASGGALGVTMTSVGQVGARRGPADATFARTLASLVATDANFDLAGRHPSFAATMVAAR